MIVVFETPCDSFENGVRAPLSRMACASTAKYHPSVQSIADMIIICSNAGQHATEGLMFRGRWHKGSPRAGRARAPSTTARL